MFGSSIAISKDTLLVGSQDDSTEVSKAGSAHVYTRSDTQWKFQQRLVPAPAASGASFGYTVALRGDEAIIGAPRFTAILAPVATTPGEAFVFRRTGNAWKQTQLLKATLPRSSDSFGSGLALTDTAVLIGACGDSSGAQGVGADASRRDALYTGAGYLFAREGQDWKLSAYLKANNAGMNDSFGFGVALSENAAVVSAIWEQSKAAGVNGNEDDNSLTTPGAVYVFK
jgi:trimeric autotransporter adhesin